MTQKSVFAVVVGSGFAGSLLSWILQRQERAVLMIDRAAHPRFAIGESSTPVADFLLAHIADRWGLPELSPLAAFGTWQATYPNLRCGLKRGFSYFGHRRHESFGDDESNSRSLLVAASATDAWSDTHWYRADVDAFLAEQACSSGVELLERANLHHAAWDTITKQWKITIETIVGEEVRLQQVTSSWLIDASGAGNATAPWCGHTQQDDWMRTRSSALFGHFDDVASFSQTLPNYPQETKDFFDSDDAAQHHVTEDGWFWVLRFQGNRTSVGLVQPHSPKHMPAMQGHADWQRYLAAYPSIDRMIENSKLVDPKDENEQPKLQFVARMSRCRSHAAGQGWVLLPVAFGFVDPLHSSGIAHALSGVTRVADCLLGDEQQCEHKLATYSRDVRNELEWIDTLVSGCYAGLPSFEHFAAYAAFYFAGTIGYENQLAKDPTHWPNGFLSASDIGLRKAAEELWQLAHGGKHKDAPKHYIEKARLALEPWNTVGLLDANKKNRLNHTAPAKRAAIMGSVPGLRGK